MHAVESLFRRTFLHLKSKCATAGFNFSIFVAGTGRYCFVSYQSGINPRLIDSAILYDSGHVTVCAFNMMIDPNIFRRQKYPKSLDDSCGATAMEFEWGFSPCLRSGGHFEHTMQILCSVSHDFSVGPLWQRNLHAWISSSKRHQNDRLKLFQSIELAGDRPALDSIYVYPTHSTGENWTKNYQWVGYKSMCEFYCHSPLESRWIVYFSCSYESRSQ